VLIEFHVNFDIIEEALESDIAASEKVIWSEGINFMSADQYADYASFENYIGQIILDYKWGGIEDYHYQTSEEGSMYISFHMKRLDGSRANKNTYEVGAPYHFYKKDSKKEKGVATQRKRLSGSKRCKFRNIVVKIKGIDIGDITKKPYDSYREALESLDRYLASEQKRHSR
jgi:hypothetical protein